jgi:hypothetical protein
LLHPFFCDTGALPSILRETKNACWLYVFVQRFVDQVAFSNSSISVNQRHASQETGAAMFTKSLFLIIRAAKAYTF